MNIKNWSGKFAIVDASSMKGMPEIIRPEDVIEVIDHRVVDIEEVKRTFPNARIQIELVGAAATLLAERYKKEPSKEVATMIYCAIISNTLNLQTKNTTERDKNILKEILKISQEAKDVAREMLTYKTKKFEENLRENIINDFKWWELDEIKIGIAQLEPYGAEGILNKKDEIIGILNELKENLELDYCFLNMPDIKDGKNYFIFVDDKSREFLLKYIDFKIEDDIGILNHVMLRKEVKKFILNTNLALT